MNYSLVILQMSVDWPNLDPKFHYFDDYSIDSSIFDILYVRVQQNLQLLRKQTIQYYFPSKKTAASTCTQYNIFITIIVGLFICCVFNISFCNYHTISSYPFLNQSLSMTILTIPLTIRTTVSIITLQVFEFISLRIRQPYKIVDRIIDFRTSCWPDRLFFTLENFQTMSLSQLVSVELLFSVEFKDCCIKLCFFLDRNSYEKQINNFFNYDLTMSFISPTPEQDTLNIPILLSQKLFWIIPSCQIPTKSPLFYYEVIQNMPLSTLRSGGGQNIKVCCQPGFKLNQNDSEGTKSPKCYEYSVNYSYQPVRVSSGSQSSVNDCTVRRIRSIIIRVVIILHYNFFILLLNIYQFFILIAQPCILFNKQIYSNIYYRSLMTTDTFKVPQSKKSLKTRGIEGSADIWIKEMAERDTVLWGMQKPLWVVDNKIYDLTQFISKHPGGSSWLTLTKGHDITMLFKTHHLDQQKVQKILQKYYVCQAPIKNEPRFELSNHFIELKKRVLNKFTIEQLQNTKVTQFRCYLLTLIWLVFLSMTGYFQSYIMAMMSGACMVTFYGIGHLFIHKRDGNLLRNVFLLIGFTAQQQQIIHAISHHPYSNTMLDYQYGGFQPIIKFPRVLPENKWYSPIVLQLLFMTVAPSNTILKLIVVPLTKKQLPNLIQGAILLQLLYLYAFCGSFGLAIKLWLLMLLTFGFCFGKTIVCPHRQPQLWSEGAPEIKDFVIHMIATTADLSHEKMSPYRSLVQYAGFNIHVVHHFFPTVDHSKLYECNEILLQYCKEKGIKMAVNGMAKCNKKMLDLQLRKEQFNLKNFLVS